MSQKLPKSDQHKLALMEWAISVGISEIESEFLDLIGNKVQLIEW